MLEWNVSDDDDDVVAVVLVVVVVVAAMVDEAFNVARFCKEIEREREKEKNRAQIEEDLKFKQNAIESDV